MTPIPLSLKDEEGYKKKGEEEVREEEGDEEDKKMVGEDPMYVGDAPSPTLLVDPYAPSSSKAIAPLKDTLGIPRL